MHLLGNDNFQDINTMKDSTMFCIGPNSKTDKFLQEELNLDELTYHQFMSTMCVQAAHHVMSKQLFSTSSLLKDKIKISEASYNSIWKLIFEKKQLPTAQKNTSWREKPSQEILKTIVNKLPHSISITVG
jgi:hypothetical protein